MGRRGNFWIVEGVALYMESIQRHDGYCTAGGIEAGRVQIFTTENGQRRVLRESGAGEYFGEIALLLEVPRTASVRALASTHLLVLRKEDFDTLVAEHLYLSRALELESSRRLIHSRRSAVPT